MKFAQILLLSYVITFAAVVQFGSAADPQAAAENRRSPAERSLPERMQEPDLVNPVRVHARVISGGSPAGDAAFRRLQELGVRTVISVDGAAPDVETARKFGLRYVHLPHGYDGIPAERRLELARAVRDLPGPVYIHCHHGKHRSPAAAAVACVAAGLLPRSQGLNVLQLAETSPRYLGLFAAVRDSTPVESQQLNAVPVNFREIEPIPPMASAMVELEELHDRLHTLADAQWRPITASALPEKLSGYPALLLRECFTELLRTEEVQQKPADFREWLENSRQAAGELEEELNRLCELTPDRIAHQTRLLQRITQDCRACHARYRDVPQTETAN